MIWGQNKLKYHSAFLSGLFKTLLLLNSKCFFSHFLSCSLQIIILIVRYSCVSDVSPSQSRNSSVTNMFLQDTLLQHTPHVARFYTRRQHHTRIIVHSQRYKMHSSSDDERTFLFLQNITTTKISHVSAGHTFATDSSCFTSHKTHSTKCYASIFQKRKCGIKTENWTKTGQKLD